MGFLTMIPLVILIYQRFDPYKGHFTQRRISHNEKVLVHRFDNQSLLLPGLVLVTAADSGHFFTLIGCLWALRRTEDKAAKLVIFDLGLSFCQLDYLEVVAACFLSSGVTIDIKKFHFERYPSHFSLANSTYSWKVG